ncbi:glycosyltransferase 87 family protein [Gordonia sp. HY285]|uniref:glycosyltransferase 87 family protein n=1 Tax=Gordonia liuliyuniae TaxID=2911517 RepID=UPI001F02A3B5|nr:glycosyltransferase 87 family protein [Gordonia liuliyuniae]MCF8610749.1 glycosyltransferase 87 family protein [Gordonia liuliyuniae]
MEDRSSKRTTTWTMIAVAACAAALVICWHIWAVPFTDPVYGLFHNGIDTRVYRGGAIAVWEGTPLYDLPVYRVWRFTYTPFAGLVMVPLAGFVPHTALLLWNIGNVISLLLVVGVSMHALRFRFDARLVLFTVCGAIASTALEPVHTTLWNGQINLVLALVVILDLTVRSERLRGVGVGLAAGIKLTPLFFVVDLLVTKRFRAAAVATGTFAATVVVGILVLGDEARRFWTTEVSETSRIGRLDAPANQTFHGYFARLATYGVANPPSWLWLPVGLVVGVLGLWAARAAYRAGANLLAISITGMTSCAIGPFSWGHHWVWVLPLLLVATVHAADHARAARPASWVWWLAPAAIVALTFAYTQPSIVPIAGSAGKVFHGMVFGPFRGFVGSATVGWHLPLQLVASGAYLIVLLGTIAVTLWWAKRAQKDGHVGHDGAPAISSS